MAEQELADETLRRRLEQAEATLAALRRGELDAFIGKTQPLMVRLKSVEEEKDRYQKMLNTVRRINQLIVRTRDPEQLLKEAADCLTHTGIIQAIWIALLDRQGKVCLRIESGWGEALDAMAAQMDACQGPPCLEQVLATAEVVALEDSTTSCAGCPLQRHFTDSIPMAARFEHGNKVYGMMATRISSAMGHDQETRHLFAEIAHDLGFALYQLELEDAHRLATAKLQESEARYRSLVESSTDHLFILGADGVYLSSNERVGQLGLQRGSELIGKRLEEVYPAEVVAIYGSQLAQVIRTGAPVRFEHRSHDPVGRWREYEDTLYPIIRDGRLWAIGGICRDVTEQRRLEHQLRQAQKMEAIGRLAGGVAHDFNNMLSVITGYAEMALDKLAPFDPLHGDIEEILKAAERSADLTKQLLAFARQQTVAPKVVDLNEVVENSHKMLHRLIGEDIQLTWIPDPDLWQVKIDPSQVDQILANLAVNSRDAIDGVGTIIVETTNVILDDAYCNEHLGFTPGEFVRLSFSDSGSGMDKETLRQIFEPFFTTKEEGMGTGLGLATVYGIIKQNQGFINVYSEPGQGTTFKIYLPRFTGEPVVTRVAETARLLTGTETILVVEDETQILRFCQRVLERFGYTVIAASSPGEAILLCEKHTEQIHLLITDVVMPTMNGKELKARIEAIKPGIKAIFMSGYTANVIAHRGVLAGDVSFIQKPFAPKELAKKVREMLDSCAS